MQCMKCGREIPVGQVFCDECLEDMEKYPVKPGTAVQLPPRPKAAPVKKQNSHRRPALPLEEQVKVLKRRVWKLGAMLTLVLALLIGVAALSADYILENRGKPLPGQNYSTTETTGTTEPSAK